MEEEIIVNISFSAMEMMEEIYNYKSEYSRKAADKYIDGILKLIQRLTKHPESCAPCRNTKLHNKGYRCCIFIDHLLIYEIEENMLNVLAIIHSKRNPNDIEF